MPPYRVVVSIPTWALKKWWLVAYKIPPQLDGWYRDLHEIEPGEKFQNVIAEYVSMALAGKELPEAIAPTILNLANDVLSGREMTVRTGDYIALQKFIK